MNNIVKLFLLVAVVAGLFGCAGSKPSVDPKTQTDASAEAPRDSLRAKFQLTISNPDGSTRDLDAVLFSVPGKRYRMELTGPLGIGVASLLWKEEGWQMTFPTEKLYVQGVGYMVGLLNDNSVPLVHIHQMADLFDGRLLPEEFETLEQSGDSVTGVLHGEGAVYAREKSGRIFSFARESVTDESGATKSHVAWISRPGRDGKPETIRFYDFREFEGVETPSKIIFERGGKTALDIRVKKVNRNKSFSSGTWRLNIPKSFKRVGE